MSWLTWRDAVIADLSRYKAAGVEFPDAWRSTLIRHPPRQMDMGPSRPTLEDEVPVLEFFEVACSDAWHGRREALGDLPTALEGGLTRNWPRVGDRSAMSRYPVG